MFNLFQKSEFQYMLLGLKAFKFQKIYYLTNDNFTALQIVRRSTLKSTKIGFDGHDGFVIVILFKLKKSKKELHYFNLLSNSKYFNLFYHEKNENLDIFLIDCKNKKRYVEKTTMKILQEVYEIKDEVFYPKIVK